MRKAIVGAFFVVVAFGALSCDSPKKSFAEGEVHLGTGGQVPFPGGSLAKGGGDYYGYCSYSGGLFEFEIGTSSMSSVNSTQEVYLRVNDIEGPPDEGVYDDPAATELQPKDDGEFGFGTVIVRNGAATFSFTQEQVGADSCYFESFAQPVSGELTIDGRKKFDFYVHIDCNGLSSVTSNGTSLNSIDADFFFRNCD